VQGIGRDEGVPGYNERRRKCKVRGWRMICMVSGRSVSEVRGRRRRCKYVGGGGARYVGGGGGASSKANGEEEV